MGKLINEAILEWQIDKAAQELIVDLLLMIN